MPDNAVRYVQLRSLSTLFTPATRSFGNIAMIGATTATGTLPPFAIFTDPDTANATFPGDLGASIAMAFRQTPGPTVVYGIPSTGTDLTAALTVASTLDAQLVVLANTPLTATTVTSAAGTNPGGVHFQLSSHVTSVSKEDGKERMGVAMLPKDSTDITNILKNERMVYIAHKSDQVAGSDQDAAAAVAGTIAGYEPYVSLLLKPVNIIMKNLFSPAEIISLNDSEDFGSPPKGKGVNWLTSPSLLPGGGIYMGEGYTGNNDSTIGKKFIDIVRTIDDVSFNLKARLIGAIGILRISRSGLRSLVAQMEAVLDPYVRRGVLDSYEVVIPILTMLDKNPNTLTQSEIDQIRTAEAQRLVEVLVLVKYNAQIHRLAITLTFE